MDNELTRRELIKKGGIIAIGLSAPAWLSSIARADVLKTSKGGVIDPDGVLVVIQLSGGNDGLNTVVPFTDPKYYELRPHLGIPADKVLKISDKLGLHPAMPGLADLYKQGKVAVIQNVGYPKPNRSHFKSMDIWNQANPDSSLSYGWIGRHLDAVQVNKKLNPVYALGLSTEKPKALDANKVSVPCFASLADIQSMVGDPDAERLLRTISSGAGTNEERLVQMANAAAFDAMVELKEKLKTFSPKEAYGKSKFGVGLQQIAQLVATSPMTRVVYFSTGGFDTHANQAKQHEELLAGFSEAIQAFQKEMEAIGKDKKVTVLVFSEFGRRSYENASAGTDHGAAAPMFLIGSRVKGGFYGPIPNLNDLSDGDLKFAIDFRQVYATTLDQWMGGESEKVLSGKFQHLPVFRS